MIADTSHSNHLFPLSKHCCAVDLVLQQIRSKHSDRCIHKNGSRGPGVCSSALNYLSNEQLSQLPFVYPPWRRVGEVEQRRLLERNETRRSQHAEADANISEKCPITVLSNVLQHRPFGLVPYFKFIALKCGKVSHLKMLIDKIVHSNARKLTWSMSEWLQRTLSQFFSSTYIKPNG